MSVHWEPALNVIAISFQHFVTCSDIEHKIFTGILLHKFGRKFRYIQTFFSIYITIRECQSKKIAFKQ